mmetsp:Transcript_63831/g.198114  ORF Transcript_63831/g.198114 Transcript_63831/m.198114 type:complete len:465 (-) Transcript_63831:2050-3444(-)
MLHVATENRGVHQERLNVLLCDGRFELLLHICFHLGKVLGLESVTRAANHGLQLTLEDCILHVLREAPVRHAHLAAGELDGTRWPIQGLHSGQVVEIVLLAALLEDEERNVAHRLGGRRDLHDVAAPLVHVVVHLQHGVPVVGVAQGAALRVHVRVLASWDLVLEDARRHRLHPALEHAVHIPDEGPILVQGLEHAVVDLWVTWLALHGCQEGVQRRLRGAIGKGREASVHNVTACVCHRMQRCQLRRRRIVRVEVDWQVADRTDHLDQWFRMRGLQQPGHVLDCDHVRTRCHALLAKVMVVVQRVDLLVFREEVACETHRDLGDFVHRAHCLDGHLHLLNVVETIENPVDVHASLRRDPHEVLHDIVWVGLVADAVCPAQEHLEANVRDCLPELGEPLEGILVEEAVGHVESGTAPVLKREELVQVFAHLRRCLEHVHRAHARGHQGLVSVAHCGVRHQHAVL